MINSYMLKLLIILMMLCINAYAFDQDIPNPVKVEIITNQSELIGGEDHKIGVHFKLDPGWHIYWKNSGDSGLPTRVSFTLPDGILLKDTHYPVPKTFLREGNILDYGYEDELLLVSDIIIPSSYNGGNFKITTEANWVACKEVCIPGSENLELQYPVTNANNLAQNKLFNSWIAKKPHIINNDRLPYKYSVNKEYNEEGKLKQVDITLNWDEEVKNVEIFPDVDKSVYMKDIIFNSNKNISTYSFSPVIFNKNKKDLKELIIVISYDNIKGQRVGIETTLNLSS